MVNGTDWDVALSHGMILGEIGVYSRMIINRGIISTVQDHPICVGQVRISYVLMDVRRLYWTCVPESWMIASIMNPLTLCKFRVHQQSSQARADVSQCQH